MSLLNCSVCGSDDVTVHGKHGAMLHTTCNGCGIDSWPMIQKYLADQNRRREASQTKEVVIIRSRFSLPQ